MHYNFEGNKYTLREATLSNLFCFSSEKGSALKGKNLHPLERIYSEEEQILSFSEGI